MECDGSDKGGITTPAMVTIVCSYKLVGSATTGRLSELIALAEAGLQAEEDDNAFFTQSIEAVDEAEATYYR